MAGGNQIVIECDPLWLKAIAMVGEFVVVCYQ